MEHIPTLVRTLVSQLTPDLLQPKYRGANAVNRLKGHCSVASEALFHLLGGPESGWVPQNVQHEGDSHWYLKHRHTGVVLDPTAGQFKTPVPYHNGRGRGFPTPKQGHTTQPPSKRAQILIDRTKAAMGKLKKNDESLQKGLGGLIAAGMLAAAPGQTQAPDDAPKPMLVDSNRIVQTKQQVQPYVLQTMLHGTQKWAPHGLPHEMLPIAHLESSFGQNMLHAPSAKGDFDTAYGPVGFKPNTAHEQYLKTPALKKQFPGLEDPATFTHRFKNDWNFHNLVAGAHFLTLKHRHGNLERAIYAWRHGTGAASAASDEQVRNEPYVMRYRDLAASLGTPKPSTLHKTEDQHAPDTLLHMLKEDHDPVERSLALKSANITPHHLREALQDEDPSIRELAIKHPKLTPELLHEVLLGDDDHAISTALDRNDLNEAQLNTVAFNPKWSGTVLNHPGCTESLRDALSKHPDVPSGVQHQALKKNVPPIQFPGIGVLDAHGIKHSFEQLQIRHGKDSQAVGEHLLDQLRHTDPDLHSHVMMLAGATPNGHPHASVHVIDNLHQYLTNPQHRNELDNQLIETGHDWDTTNIQHSFEAAHKAYKALQRHANSLDEDEAPASEFNSQVEAWLNKADLEEPEINIYKDTLTKKLNSPNLKPLEKWRYLFSNAGYIHSDPKFVDGIFSKFFNDNPDWTIAKALAYTPQVDDGDQAWAGWKQPLSMDLPQFHTQLIAQESQPPAPNGERLPGAAFAKLPEKIKGPIVDAKLAALSALPKHDDSDADVSYSPYAKQFNSIVNLMNGDATSDMALKLAPFVPTEGGYPSQNFKNFMMSQFDELPESIKEQATDIHLAKMKAERPDAYEGTLDHIAYRGGPSWLSKPQINSYLEKLSSENEVLGESQIDLFNSPKADPKWVNRVVERGLNADYASAAKNNMHDLIASKSPHIAPELLDKVVSNYLDSHGNSSQAQHALNHPKLAPATQQKVAQYVLDTIKNRPQVPAGRSPHTSGVGAWRAHTIIETLDRAVEALPGYDIPDDVAAQLRLSADSFERAPHAFQVHHRDDPLIRMSAERHEGLKGIGLENVRESTHSVKLGTSKMRLVRDLIQASGKPSLPPKQLPAGDWSKFRDKSGNISAELLQAGIDATPGHDVHLQEGEPWYGTQRHDNQPSKVLLYNLSGKQVKQMKAAGVWNSYLQVHDATVGNRNYNHPKSKDLNTFTVGWVRHTGGLSAPDRTGNGYSARFTATEPTYQHPHFVDEFQTDINQYGLSNPLHAQELGIEIPPEHVPVIKQICFGGKHPSEFLHECYKEYQRKQGNVGAYATHDVSTKAPISGMRPDEPLPAHMLEGYHNIPKKLGMQPGVYQDLKVPEPDQGNLEADAPPAKIWQGDIRKREE